MSEQNTAPAGEQNEQGQEQGKEFVAITSQADFDSAIQARLARERAKFADYDDVKAAAGRLTEIENASKTESERQLERSTELERENAELKFGKTRAEVAEAKSDPAKGIVIPASMLTGSTKEELEASADALIQFKGEKQTTRLLIPNEGNSPSRQVNDEQEFVSEMFGRGN